MFEGAHIAVEWLRTDTARYTEPFFEQTLRRLRRLPENAGRAQRTPIDALAAMAGGADPTAIVFHASRCGSTLLCQMLASLDDSVVISEAPVIDDVLRARPRDASVENVPRSAWLRGAIGALLQPSPASPRRTIVKLDAWHIFELDLVRAAFPGVPFVFVHRHPLEILVSIARMPSLAVVRDTVTPAQLGLSAEERDRLTTVELAAVVVGAYYRAARDHCDGLLPIAYADLPSAAWRLLPGPPFSAHEVARMREAASRDAKEPTRAFTADADAKIRSASHEIRNACTRWAAGPYAAWLEAIERR